MRFRRYIVLRSLRHCVNKTAEGLILDIYIYIPPPEGSTNLTAVAFSCGSLKGKSNRRHVDLKTPVENVRLLSASSTWLFYSYLYKWITIFASCKLPGGAAMLARSLPMKTPKRLARDLFHTFAKYTAIVYDDIDTDSWAQSSKLSKSTVAFSWLSDVEI